MCVRLQSFLVLLCVCVCVCVCVCDREKERMCVRLQSLLLLLCVCVRSEEHTSELQSHLNLVCRVVIETPPTEIYTLSLHAALPILCVCVCAIERKRECV